LNFLLNLYFGVLETASPVLDALLARRLRRGKEDVARLPERKGQSGLPRPSGTVIWLHGASVGEAQSTLILIEQLRHQFPAATVLLTTGTVTSANYLSTRLPAGVIHQYYPVDRPQWVERFLNHWQPDFVIWMESELWPAMLCGLQKSHTPVVLLNARLSQRSLKRWQMFPDTARTLLQTFSLILTQTEDDACSYRALGAADVSVSGNLKYASQALPVNEADLAALKSSLHDRPVWLYASTHKGEEELACRLHKRLTEILPGILTIIVPRHPERRDDIVKACGSLKTLLRTNAKVLPTADTQIYIADTLGELGLFYRAAPLACIGRCFSDDGGGGHNPIEAAQLGCAVIYGPRVQNLQEIYDDMSAAGAAMPVANEDDFYETLAALLTQPQLLQTLAEAGKTFTQSQGTVLTGIMDQVMPVAHNALNRKAQAA
jgi:3-deoxy-D-manno-octulosonic-acid transferase